MGGRIYARRSIPLRRGLLAIAFAGILPLALVAGIGLMLLVSQQEKQIEHRNRDVTRLAATAIETEIGRSMGVMDALSLSPLLDTDQLDQFSTLVQRLLPLVPEWQAVLIVTPEGEVVRRIYPDRIADSGFIADLQSFTDVISTGLPQIGDLGRGPHGAWGMPLRVPATRDGTIRYVLTAVLKPSAVLNVINTRGLPEGWVLTVLDGQGRRIGRTHAHEETIGRPASPSLVELLASTPELEGFGLSHTIEGAPVYTAFVRLHRGTSWTVAAGVPQAVVRDAALRSFLLYGGGLALSLLFAIMAATIATRRINRQMEQLRAAAQAIGERQIPVAPKTNITELLEVGSALVAAGQARVDSEAERDQVVVKLERAQRELKLQVSDLEQLQVLSHQLIQLPTMQEQFAAIVDSAGCLLNADFIALLLCEDGEQVFPAAQQHFAAGPGPLIEGSGVFNKYIQAAVRKGRPLVVTDSDMLEPFRSLHSAPLMSGDGTVTGALLVMKLTSHQPNARELHLATLCAGLAAVYRDRNRMQLEAGLSQQRLKVALESSSVPFCILAPIRTATGTIADFRFEFINIQGAAVLERPVAALKDTAVGRVLGDWQQSQVFKTLVEVVGGGETREFDQQNVNRGHESWVHIIATAFQGGVAVWFADITERKRQERIIIEADRRKDEFLATLAHELRNPLAPIRMAATLFGSPKATDKQKERSQQIIERQVTHMALLLDDLFDISRITLGKLSLRTKLLDLRDVASAALETARPKLESRHHHFSLELPEQPIMVDADPLRLEQVITNLLTNAAKFTPEGGEVRLTLYQRNDYACAVVSDNGVGVAPEQMSRIFDKFVQAPAQRGVVTTGLGIGLALAQELTRLHGGQVLGFSEGLGKGSRFTVKLPLSAAAVVTADAAGAVARNLALRRILVADDNRDIAETLVAILKMEGHEVTYAYDGEAALALYEQMKPEVLLLDIGMPRMRGDEVARAVRALPGGERVLLVAMTGWGQPQDRANAIEAGFDVHLTKPVDVEVLLDLIAERPRS